MPPIALGVAANSYVGSGSITINSLVKQDLMNHFNIRKGEKLENPDFGTNIWEYIFDPLDVDTKNAIISDVEAVGNYDPRVTIDQVQVNEYEHLSLIHISEPTRPY